MGPWRLGGGVPRSGPGTWGQRQIWTPAGPFQWIAPPARGAGLGIHSFLPPSPDSPLTPRAATPVHAREAAMGLVPRFPDRPAQIGRGEAPARGGQGPRVEQLPSRRRKGQEGRGRPLWRLPASLRRASSPPRSGPRPRSEPGKVWRRVRTERREASQGGPSGPFPGRACGAGGAAARAPRRPRPRPGAPPPPARGVGRDSWPLEAVALFLSAVRVDQLSRRTCAPWPGPLRRLPACSLFVS